MAALDLDSIKNLTLFQGLTAPELEALSLLIFEKNYSKSSTLFVEGMTGEVLYLVKTGSVQILKKFDNHEEKILATLKAGEFLGEMSLIDNRPRTATARVAEESTLLVMTKKAFNAMMEKHPAAALKVILVFLKVANERVRKANESFKQI
ncbi:MAG: cyclic nucleotide-binding domain-containing protein [bacterium]